MTALILKYRVMPTDEGLRLTAWVRLSDRASSLRVDVTEASVRDAIDSVNAQLIELGYDVL